MNWQQIAMRDNQTILNDHGTEIKITDPTGYEYPSLHGQVVRVDSMLDPMTGRHVYEPRLVATIPLASFVSASVPIPPLDQFGDEPVNPLTRMQSWFIQTTDATGEVLKKKIVGSHYDRSIGFVNLICEDYVELEGFR